MPIDPAPCLTNGDVNTLKMIAASPGLDSCQLGHFGAAARWDERLIKCGLADQGPEAIPAWAITRRGQLFLVALEIDCKHVVTSVRRPGSARVFAHVDTTTGIVDQRTVNGSQLELTLRWVVQNGSIIEPRTGTLRFELAQDLILPGDPGNHFVRVGRRPGPMYMLALQGSVGERYLRGAGYAQ